MTHQVHHVSANYTGNGAMSLSLTVPAFNSHYLRQLVRTKSFPALQPLFEVAQDPAKEWTESYAALSHLRPWLYDGNEYITLHVGDGKHCRTGALFAFNSKHLSVSIDPAIDVRRMHDWRDNFDVQRFLCFSMTDRQWLSLRLPEFLKQRRKFLVSFVHAHVNVAEFLSALPDGSWAAAYTNACCEKSRQLVAHDNPRIKIHKSGDDWSILSQERSYQVLVPR